MRTIIDDFKGSFQRIYNNFYFSFLAINYRNLPNLPANIILDADMDNNVMTRESLKNLSQDEINEYGASIKRHFINDMIIVYERYASTMYASHINDKVRIDPATIDNRSIRADKFEQIPNIFDTDEKNFFVQLRRLRNSIVHFNGVYTFTNPLNYTFNDDTYQSSGKEGDNITIKFETLLWIYKKMSILVDRLNHKYVDCYL